MANHKNSGLSKQSKLSKTWLFFD